MKNLFNFFKKEKTSVKVENVPVNIPNQLKITKGLFEVTDEKCGNHFILLEGIYYEYPNNMKFFISTKGALVSSVKVRLIKENEDIEQTPELLHALECLENSWAMRFHQLSDFLDIA